MEQSPNVITPFQAWTMIIAGMSLLLSCGSLFWQVRSWRASGPRIRCDVRVGWDNSIASVWADADTEWTEIIDFAPGMDTDTRFLVLVRVVNTGRHAASVGDIELHVSKGIGLKWPHMDGPTLPHRLDGHDQTEWTITLEQLATGIQNRLMMFSAPAFGEMEARPVLTLGTGDRVSADVGLRAVDVIRCWERIATARNGDSTVESRPVPPDAN